MLRLYSASILSYVDGSTGAGQLTSTGRPRSELQNLAVTVSSRQCVMNRMVLVRQQGGSLTPKKRTSLICDCTSHRAGFVDGVTAGNIGFEEVDTAEIR